MKLAHALLFLFLCLGLVSGAVAKPANRSKTKSTDLILKSADLMDNTMDNGNLISEL
jgi:hypothetical protein